MMIRARAHISPILPLYWAVLGSKRVKIEIFKKIPDFGPKTLLIPKNEL